MFSPSGGVAFCREFGLCVNPLRVGEINLPVGRGPAGAGAEDIVGTHLDQRAIDLSADFDQMGNARHVHGPAEFRFFFSLVDVRIGGRVDHCPRTSPLQEIPDAAGVRKIKLGLVGANRLSRRFSDASLW